MPAWRYPLPWVPRSESAASRSTPPSPPTSPHAYPALLLTRALARRARPISICARSSATNSKNIMASPRSPQCRRPLHTMYQRRLLLAPRQPRRHQRPATKLHRLPPLAPRLIAAGRGTIGVDQATIGHWSRKNMYGRRTQNLISETRIKVSDFPFTRMRAAPCENRFLLRRHHAYASARSSHSVTLSAANGSGLRGPFSNTHCPRSRSRIARVGPPLPQPPASASTQGLIDTIRKTDSHPFIVGSRNPFQSVVKKLHQPFFNKFPRPHSVINTFPTPREFSSSEEYTRRWRWAGLLETRPTHEGPSTRSTTRSKTNPPSQENPARSHSRRHPENPRDRVKTRADRAVTMAPTKGGRRRPQQVQPRRATTRTEPATN